MSYELFESIIAYHSSCRLELESKDSGNPEKDYFCLKINKFEKVNVEFV